VLLILRSWDITFAQKKAGLSISYLGYIRIYDGGPFRQIARYNDHRNAPIPQLTAYHYKISVLVRTAIDLAIGILRVPCRNNINIVILPDKRNVLASSDQISYWKSNPETKQLEEIRFSLEKLVQELSVKVNNYESDEETTNRMEMFSFVGNLFQPLSHGVQKAAARVALVISNLKL
jgi:hypothetical protein